MCLPCKAHKHLCDLTPDYQAQMLISKHLLPALCAEVMFNYMKFPEAF